MSQLAASFDRLARRFGAGQSITFRRRSSLLNSATGAPTSTLAAAGAALAGATSITVDGPSLTGTLPAGAQITIGGHSYTAAAAATAASGQLAVSLTSALVAPVADNAVVTVSQPYGDLAFFASRVAAADVEVEGDAVLETERRRYHVSAVGAPGAPERGDVVLDGTERRLKVIAVRSRRPGTDELGWTIDLGDAG